MCEGLGAVVLRRIWRRPSVSRRILRAFCVGKDLRGCWVGKDSVEKLLLRRSLGAAVFWRIHESCPIGKDLRECCVEMDLRGFSIGKWRRKWQSTPVFLPGESQGRGSLVGCHLWGRTESDTTEVT